MRHTLLIAVMATSCTPVQADLEPATAADEVRFLERAARGQEGDIVMIAQAAAWPGDAIITQKVSPLRLRIENHGEVPVAVHLGKIALEGSSGRTYLAVPPVLLSGSVDHTAPPPTPLTPGYEASRFVIASKYRTIYPRRSAYGGTFNYDLNDNRMRYGYWDIEELLPTPEMIGNALPEGVLESGGDVTGWVYFEKVDQDAETQVALAAAIMPVEGQVPLAEFEVPFVTE